MPRTSDQNRLKQISFGDDCGALSVGPSCALVALHSCLDNDNNNHLLHVNALNFENCSAASNTIGVQSEKEGGENDENDAAFDLTPVKIIHVVGNTKTTASACGGGDIRDKGNEHNGGTCPTCTATDITCSNECSATTDPFGRQMPTSRGPLEEEEDAKTVPFPLFLFANLKASPEIPQEQQQQQQQQQIEPKTNSNGEEKETNALSQIANQNPLGEAKIEEMEREELHYSPSPTTSLPFVFTTPTECTFPLTSINACTENNDKNHNNYENYAAKRPLPPNVKLSRLIAANEAKGMAKCTRNGESDDDEEEEEEKGEKAFITGSTDITDDHNDNDTPIVGTASGGAERRLIFTEDCLGNSSEWGPIHTDDDDDTCPCKETVEKAGGEEGKQRGENSCGASSGVSARMCSRPWPVSFNTSPHHQHGNDDLLSLITVPLSFTDAHGRSLVLRRRLTLKEATRALCLCDGEEGEEEEEKDGDDDEKEEEEEEADEQQESGCCDVSECFSLDGVPTQSTDEDEEREERDNGEGDERNLDTCKTEATTERNAKETSEKQNGEDEGVFNHNKAYTCNRTCPQIAPSSQAAAAALSAAEMARKRNDAANGQKGLRQSHFANRGASRADVVSGGISTDNTRACTSSISRGIDQEGWESIHHNTNTNTCTRYLEKGRRRRRRLPTLDTAPQEGGASPPQTDAELITEQTLAEEQAMRQYKRYQKIFAAASKERGKFLLGTVHRRSGPLCGDCDDSGANGSTSRPHLKRENDAVRAAPASGGEEEDALVLIDLATVESAVPLLNNYYDDNGNIEHQSEGKEQHQPRSCCECHKQFTSSGASGNANSEINSHSSDVTPFSAQFEPPVVVADDKCTDNKKFSFSESEESFLARKASDTAFLMGFTKKSKRLQHGNQQRGNMSSSVVINASRVDDFGDISHFNTCSSCAPNSDSSLSDANELSNSSSFSGFTTADGRMLMIRNRHPHPPTT